MRRLLVLLLQFLCATAQSDFVAYDLPPFRVSFSSLVDEPDAYLFELRLLLGEFLLEAVHLAEQAEENYLPELLRHPVTLDLQTTTRRNLAVHRDFAVPFQGQLYFLPTSNATTTPPSPLYVTTWMRSWMEPAFVDDLSLLRGRLRDSDSVVLQQHYDLEVTLLDQSSNTNNDTQRTQKQKLLLSFLVLVCVVAIPFALLLLWPSRRNHQDVLGTTAQDSVESVPEDGEVDEEEGDKRRPARKQVLPQPLKPAPPQLRPQLLFPKQPIPEQRPHVVYDRDGAVRLVKPTLRHSRSVPEHLSSIPLSNVAFQHQLSLQALNHSFDEEEDDDEVVLPTTVQPSSLPRSTSDSNLQRLRPGPGHRIDDEPLPPRRPKDAV